MPDLISGDIWDEVRSAIKDVTDTFADTLVTITNYEDRKATLFGESGPEETRNKLETVVKAVSIYDSNSNSSMVTKSQFGSMDLSEGYVLFNFEDMDEAGLINHLDQTGLINPEEIVKFNPNTDTITFFGQTYQSEGVNLLGPHDGTFALVKIHFKRKVKKTE